MFVVRISEIEVHPEWLEAYLAAGKAILIAPNEPLEISRVCHDPDVMQRIYDIGRRAGELVLKSLLGMAPPENHKPFVLTAPDSSVNIFASKAT